MRIGLSINCHDIEYQSKDTPCARRRESFLDSHSFIASRGKHNVYGRQVRLGFASDASRSCLYPLIGHTK
jgi:hypothetical protein